MQGRYWVSYSYSVWFGHKYTSVNGQRLANGHECTPTYIIWVDEMIWQLTPLQLVDYRTDYLAAFFYPSHLGPIGTKQKKVQQNDT